MEETSSTRKLTRDYRGMSESPWTLWDLIISRRSCRKYQEGVLPAGFTAQLEETVSLASGVRGAAPGSIIAVTDQQLGAGLRRRLYKGLVNKMNLWMARAPVNSFLVMAVPDSDARGERPRQVPAAAMAMQDCVLWLTERGLGTCWLGGVSSREVVDLLELDPGFTVPVVVCLGTPREGSAAFSYDNILRRALSVKRKPLSEVACLETLQESYAPGRLDTHGFAASGTQSVTGLLKVLGQGTGEGDAPLDLVVEACLEAARLAPSAGNSQSWRFVAVRDAGSLERLAGACGADGPWRAAVVATGRAVAYMTGLMDKTFWMIDVPIALSHISLMAASAGLRAEVFVEGIDEDALNGLVGAEGDIRTVGAVGIS